MGLALKVKLFAITVALFVQESAGYNTTPFPANFSASPPIESPPGFVTHGKPIDTPSPASQPNGSVFHGSPVLPPLSSSPVGPVPVASPSSYSPQMPPTIRPTVPGSMPPSPNQSKTPEYTAPISMPMVPATSAPKKMPLIPPTSRQTVPPTSIYPEPDVSPVSTPPSSINSKRDGMPVAAPPNEARNQFSPMNPSQREAPSLHKASRPTTDASPTVSSPKSPLHMWSHSPSSLPLYKRHYRKENITSHAPSSLRLPPAPSQLGPMIPPTPLYPPKSQPKSMKGHHAHRHVNPVSPSGSPLSPSKSHVSPVSSPYPTAPSGQTKLPFLSPKNSPFGSSPRNPTTPLLPPIKVLPPPPPNEDCSSLTCPEPLTNTPPGSACGCVWPMQVSLRLSVAVYTFFPLVSELAEEIAVGVFMKQSQVRIMGANAASQDPQKTIVLIDLVPLGEKIDNTTAYLTFQRFWRKQVVINSSLFGGYEVLYVRYPGLPPSPPSSINVIDGQPYSRNGNNGRTIQPLGVDVRKGQRKDGLSGSIVAIIILSASTAVILCCAVAWLFLFKHRVCQEEPTPLATLPSLSKPSGIAASMFGSGLSSSSLSVGSSMAMYTGSAKTFSSTDLERATDNFNASRIVGEGGFGRVYSGVLEDGTKVAVKVLKRDDQQGGREFLSEVEMLSRLHHRNLVKLIGICTEERTRCLVYELIPNGCVESHLHGVDKKTAPLDWGTRMKIALGSARGLAYLHEDSNPRVIHRDFKSSNILLEHDFTPKVSDFGLARTAMDEENKHVSTRVMGTFGYVAPEYAMTGHLLVKSDVYSYGVVLLELLTGRKPIDMSQPPGQENLVTWLRPLLTSKQGLESIIDPSLGPGFPFDSIAKVAAIASMCVQQEVSNRPFMGEVVQALKLVCNECNETKEFGSTSSSLEDICIDMDARISTNSVSHLLSTSRRLGMQQDLGSFRRQSSSGSLIIERGTRLWQKMRRLSGGTVSEHRAIFRLWPGSH